MTLTAWDLIGFDHPKDYVRIVGGRTLYEAVFYQDGNRKIKLGRIDCSDGIKQIYRWVDFDTPMEIVSG